MQILAVVLSVVLTLVCLALIGLILIQRGKGGGLVGLGGGGVEQAFGTHAATLAQKATAVLAITFLALTVMLAIIRKPSATTVQNVPASRSDAASEPAAPAAQPEAPAAPAAPEAE